MRKAISFLDSSFSMQVLMLIRDIQSNHLCAFTNKGKEWSAYNMNMI